MKHLNPSFFSGLLALVTIIGSQCCAQEAVSTFSLKKSNYVVIPLEAHPTEPGPNLLFFENNKEFRFVYLDDELKHLETLSIPLNKDKLWELQIVSFMNFPDEALLYAFSDGGIGGIYLYTINKKDATFKREKLDLGDRGTLELLKAFAHGNRFLRFYFDQRNQQIVLKVFDRARLIKEVVHPVFSKDLMKTIKKAAEVGIPAISNDRTTSLAVNALSVKIYSYPEEVIFSVEDMEKGETHFWVYEADGWEVHEETYPYAAFDKEEKGKSKENMNSIIFDNYLYQAHVGENGLQIQQVDMFENRLVQSLTLANEEEIKGYLGGIYKKTFNSSGPRTIAGKDLLGHLKKSLALSFYVNDENETHLMVGAHLHMSSNEVDALNLAGMLLSFVGASFGEAGYIPIASGGNFTVGFDPFSTIDFALDMAFLAGNDRFFYGECKIDPYTLQPLGEAPEENSFDKALNFFFEEDLDRKAYGVTFFWWRNKTILGYGRKNNYFLHSFSSE